MPHLLHSAPTPTHPSQNDKIAQLFNYRSYATKQCTASVNLPFHNVCEGVS